MTRQASRRELIAGVGAALTGVIIGHALYRATGPDLTGPAEAWLDDAALHGLWVGIGPDGRLYQAEPIFDGTPRAEARELHRRRLQSHPRLERAVRAAARRGYTPEARS